MKQQLQQRAPPFAVSAQPIKSALDLLQMGAIQLRFRQLAIINGPNRLLWPPRVIFHLRQHRIALYPLGQIAFFLALCNALMRTRTQPMRATPRGIIRNRL